MVRIFQKKSNLETHKKTVHLKLTEFRCKYCSKMFKAKGNLDRHQLVHTGSRFVCDVCDKVYTDLNNLNRHKLVYVNTLFNCNVCGKRFSRKDSLSHYKKLHGKKK